MGDEGLLSRLFPVDAFKTRCLLFFFFKKSFSFIFFSPAFFFFCDFIRKKHQVFVMYFVAV